MRINEQFLVDFEKVQGKLDQILKESGITKSHILSKTNMDRTTFNRKIKKKTFTVHELKEIVKIINGKPYL